MGGDAALDVGGVCGFGEEDGAVVSGNGEGGVLVGGMRGFWGWGGGGGGNTVGAGAAEGDGVGAVGCVLACAGVLGRWGC